MASYWQHYDRPKNAPSADALALSSQLKPFRLAGSYPKEWIYNPSHPETCRTNFFNYYKGKWAAVYDQAKIPSRLLVRHDGKDKPKFYSRQYPNPSPGNSFIASFPSIIMVKGNRYAMIPLHERSRKEAIGWKVWDHPQRPIDPNKNYRDTRWVEKIEDVYNTSAPWEDTTSFFQLGVRIYRASGSDANWQPGTLIGGNTNAHLSPSLAPPIQKPWKLTNMHSATSRGHLHKYRRPYGVGAGWGDYDLFYQWQSQGRRILVEMIPPENEFNKVTSCSTVKFISRSGKEEVIARITDNSLRLENKNAETLLDEIGRKESRRDGNGIQYRTAASAAHHNSHAPDPSLDYNILHLHEATSSYLVDGISCVEHIHKTKAKGDIVFFLTGENEIERTCAVLRKRTTNLEVLPLYSTLSPAQQKQISQYAKERMCVVTTNMAEAMCSSRFVYVVDSGLVNEKVYNPRARMEILQTAPISQATADKRAWKTGDEGMCYRLYTKKTFDQVFPKTTVPIHLRSDISSTVLRLCHNDHQNVLDKYSSDIQDVELYFAAIEDLYHLGYVDHKAKITELGKRAAQITVNPVWYLAILEADKLSCSCEMVSIAALLSTKKSIFLRPYNHRHVADLAREGWANPKSDHLTLLNAFHAYVTVTNSDKIDMEQWCMDNFLSHTALRDVMVIRYGLLSTLKTMRISIKSTPPNSPEYEMNIRKALALSFFHHSAIQIPDRQTYKTVRQNMHANVNPHSVLVNSENEWVVFDKFVYSGIQYLQTVTVVEAEWLVDLPYFRNMPVTREGHPEQPFVETSLESARARMDKGSEKKS